MPESRENILTEELKRLLAEESASDAEQLQEVWALARPADAFPKEEKISNVWQQIENHLDKEIPRDLAPVKKIRPLRLVRRYAVALAAAILLGAVAVTLRLSPDHFRAPLGERLSITLADGSEVDLNSGTRLSYRTKLNGNRVVTLDGEAFFDIAHETSSFTVETFNGNIEVVGTRFSVRAWRESVERRTTIALESGQVRFSHKDFQEQGVLMAPGETWSIVDEQAAPSPADSSAYRHRMAWRYGDLIFRESLLEVALEDVERHFAVQIELSAPSFSRRHINVAFRSPDNPEIVVNDLAQALGLKFRRTAQGFELYSPSE